MDFNRAADRTARAVIAHLGQAVEYGDPPQTIRAAVDPPAPVEFSPGLGEFRSSSLAIFVRRADLGRAPEPGDAVAFDGSRYYVADVEPDGAGGYRCPLRKSP